MNIFDIKNEYLEVMTLLEENGGELTDELIERLHVNKDELNTKLGAYAYIIKEYESKQELIKDRITVLKRKSEIMDNNIEHIKSYIKLAVETYGTTTINKKTGKSSTFIETDEYKFSHIGKDSVNVTDEELVPIDCKNYIVTIQGTDYAKLIKDVTPIDSKIKVDKSLLKSKLELLESTNQTKLEFENTESDIVDESNEPNYGASIVTNYHIKIS